jgi:small subunit ribosomal protein S9
MRDTLFFAKTVGRRKKAGANLRLVPGSGKFYVNGDTIEKFFIGNISRPLRAEAPIRVYACAKISFDANIKTKGGGILGKAQALKIAIARALVVIQPRNRKIFRKYLFLSQDSRRKERRKYGLKKARKSPQFSKR